MKIDRVDIQVKYCGNEVKRKVRKSIIELDTLSWNTRKIAVDKSKYLRGFDVESDNIKTWEFPLVND